MKKNVIAAQDAEDIAQKANAFGISLVFVKLLSALDLSDNGSTGVSKMQILPQIVFV